MRYFIFIVAILTFLPGCGRREAYDKAVKACSGVAGRDYEGCIHQKLNQFGYY
jgi:hypothetical protein